jgi:adenine-specific DNA-methyltransferase
MEKLKLHTPDLTAQNVEKLAELFPNCVTESRDAEGKPIRAIDFDQLRQELAGSVVEGPQERYELNWPGKREAKLAANAPIAKTLRPYRDESVDFDTTKNLFIEGDNLDALKLLQESYLGKVKLIYIDPPYNTGNDFIYEDDFAEDNASYMLRSNQVDELGNRLVANTEANGRFHSDWLSMMYSRLRLARNLLREDGSIFISIDGTELASLRIICDEVFGAANHCGIVSRATGTRMGSGSKTIASELDYILIYSRNADLEFAGLPMTEGEAGIYDETDDNGSYLLRSLRRTGGENRREDRPSMYFPVEAPDGEKVYPIAPAGYESRWVCSPSTYENLVKSGRIAWRKVSKDGAERWQVYQKHYMGDGLKQPSNLWNDEEGNKKATRDLNALFSDRKVFDHPKPIGLLQRIINLATDIDEEQVILDFFAGSGTTAHAVWAQNLQDGGNRKFVLVQIDEPLTTTNRFQQVAFDLCNELGLPANVAEMTKERLRRTVSALRSNTPLTQSSFDLGFRVLKIDTSNMRDVYYAPDAVTQGNLLEQVDNIKPDRTPEDLLFQLLVDWGLDLAMPIASETIAGKQVFFADGNALAACFDADISEELVKELAKRKPLRAVFRDASFGSDSLKINVDQIFKMQSPETEVRSV